MKVEKRRNYDFETIGEYIDMNKKEVCWYGLIGKESAPQKLVQCDSFATALSLEEMASVIISCRIPITKFHWKLQEGEKTVILEGDHDFPPEGVGRFRLGDAVPMEKLLPYEAETARYCLNTTVTLASGDEIGSPFSFQAYLRKGVTTETVPETDLISRLNAIPIANSAMTEAELRQICMEFMRLQLEFPFRLEEDYVYTVESQKRVRRLVGGKVYGGIPYVTRGAGNLYRIAEIYDPVTGTLKIPGDLIEDIRKFGNACSGAACMAWARVVTSAYLGYSMFMTKANGYLPVGPYRYPEENVTRFSREGISCKTVCAFNGDQVLYESYALMKPADGVVCDGHVRMNSAVPVVIRKEDGTVDPDQSYALMREQVCYVSNANHLRIAPDGTHYTAQGVVDLRYSFRELFQTNYLPFTFLEFSDPSRVEPAKVLFTAEKELRERVLSANYPISDVFVELDGRRLVYRNVDFFRKEFKMGDMFPNEALSGQATIYCRLLNGALLEVPQ